MSTYYLDLEQTGTGHAGTELDMWSYADYQAIKYTFVDNDIVYVEGENTFTGTYLEISPGQTNYNGLFTWDKYGNDPWRLNMILTSSEFEPLTPGIIYKNGIIKCNETLTIGHVGIEIEFKSIVNLQIIAEKELILGDYFINYKGCRFISPQDIWVGSNCEPEERGTVGDCQFHGSFGDDTEFTGNNNEYTDAEENVGGIQTNCQFEWDAPALPAWNAAKELFASNILDVGINTPPQPGHGAPLYEGYNTDAWGNPRTGIGFSYMGGFSLNYFSDSTVADGTYVTSYINKSNLIDKIQGVTPDNYFDSTSKLEKVIVYYTHEDSRQINRIWHVLTDADVLTGPAIWLTSARDGIWQKTKVRVYDRDGAEFTLNRSDIGSGEDASHGSGNIYLNTI